MVSLRSNLQRYRELNQWMHAVQKSVLWALVRIPPRLSNPKRWDGCSRNFAIRSALLISMKKGGFPANGWNSWHQIMELAGLPAGTFEAVSLSAQEVNGLVNLMGEKLTARQYMTFLMLYSVSRELAQAGRTAAALQFIQTSRLRGASPAAMGTGRTAAALMSGGAGAMVAERSRYGVRKMSDADGNLVSAEQLALYT